MDLCVMFVKNGFQPGGRYGTTGWHRDIKIKSSVVGKSASIAFITCKSVKCFVLFTYLFFSFRDSVTWPWYRRARFCRFHVSVCLRLLYNTSPKAYFIQVLIIFASTKLSLGIAFVYYVVMYSPWRGICLVRKVKIYKTPNLSCTEYS